MMKLILLLLFSIQVYAGEISFSFDDAPTKDGHMYTGLERTKILISKLKKADVKAVFYINSIRIDINQGDLRLKQYSNAGHLIGNHTHSHSKISSVGLENYKVDIQKAHNLIKNYKNFKPWFRFPYLKRGEKESTRDSIRSFLNSNDYFNAYALLGKTVGGCNLVMLRRSKSHFVTLFQPAHWSQA